MSDPTKIAPEVVTKETLRTEHGVYLSASCGKVSATIGISDYGVHVTCHNASNRCWRGPGKRFEDIHAARAGYKSAEMIAIINAADKLNS